VKHLGARFTQPIPLREGREIAVQLDWADQANGSYLTAAVVLSPHATQGNPLDTPDWLKVAYVGVPPGRNARMLVELRAHGRDDSVETEGWPETRREGRRIGVQEINSDFATLIRTLVILVVISLIVAATGTWQPLASVSRKTYLFLFLSAPAVLGLALYNFCFVPKLNQGFWYFPVSFLYVSVYVIRLTDRLFDRLGRRMATGAGIACAVATLLGYLWIQPSSSDSSRASFFYDEAPKIRAFYGNSPPQILEYDDGIITYATGFHAMSGMGLTLDADAILAAGGIGAHRSNRNSLLELGLERGFNRFCTFSYPGRPRLTAESSDRDIRSAYSHLIGRQGRRFVFRVEYASSDGALSIIEARRRGDS